MLFKMKVAKKIALIFILLCCSLFIKAQNNYADSLKQQLTVAKEDVNKVNLFSELARFYMFFYPDTSAYYGKKGLQLARQVNYKAGQASCMLSLCISYTFSGDYISALNFGLEASPILADLHDTTLVIWNNIQIATCYRQLEDYDQALAYGFKADNFSKLFHPGYNQQSVVFGLIGSIYEKKNQLDSALNFEKKAFATDSGWCQIFQFLGQTYAKKGRLDSALNYYERGLGNSVKENNTVAFIDLCNNLSKIFESTGHTDSSLFYANKAIPQFGTKTNPEGLLELSTRLARLYEMQGKPDSTIKYLKVENTLKDILYSRKKTREAQNFAFNEKLHQQDLISQHQRDENKIRIAVLLAVVLIFLSIAFFL